MKSESNPNYVNAPFEVCGMIDGIYFVAAEKEPPPPEIRSCVWVKLPERDLMVYDIDFGWQKVVPNDTGRKFLAQIPGLPPANEPH